MLENDVYVTSDKFDDFNGNNFDYTLTGVNTDGRPVDRQGGAGAVPVAGR